MSVSSGGRGKVSLQSVFIFHQYFFLFLFIYSIFVFSNICIHYVLAHTQGDPLGSMDKYAPGANLISLKWIPTTMMLYWNPPYVTCTSAKGHLHLKPQTPKTFFKVYQENLIFKDSARYKFSDMIETMICLA